MTCVGLDIGNSSCVVVTAKGREIDVVLNDDSTSETPSLVSFFDGKRKFGWACNASLMLNPASTISQLKCLVGKQFNSVREDLQDLPFRTSKDKDGGILIHVNHYREYRFKPVHVLAMLLSHLAKTVEGYQQMSHCVIGVPSYFTDNERIAYRDAAKIAGLKNLQLMHEGSAIAVTYRFNRVTENDESSYVIFVDIGHCDTQVTIVLFDNDGIHVLAHASDWNLGGRDFTKVLYFHFAMEFDDKFRIDINLDPRARAKLMSECEKLKKVLTTENEAHIKLDSLIDGKDLVGSITRKKFEKLSSELLARIEVPCSRALQDARISVLQEYSVQLVGSGSRVPGIVSILEEYFQRNLSRSLDAKECVARGCAIQAWALSGDSGLNLPRVHDSLPFDVWGRTFCLNPLPNISMFQKPLHNTLLFHKGAKFPNTISIAFKHIKEAFRLHIDIVHDGNSRMMKFYKVDIGNISIPNDAIPNVEAKLGVDHDGITFLLSAKLRSTQPATLGVTQPSHSSGDNKMIKTKVEAFTDLQITDAEMGLTEDDFAKIQELENKLVYMEESSKEAQERKDELDAYTCLVIKNLNKGVYGNMLSSFEKERCLSILSEMEIWLEDHNEEESIVYVSRLDNLKKWVGRFFLNVVDAGQGSRPISNNQNNKNVSSESNENYKRSSDVVVGDIPEQHVKVDSEDEKRTTGRTHAIGIDLGSTYSCVGVWRRGGVEIIHNGVGNKTTPSYVCFTETHHLVGEGARNQAAMNPMNTIYDVKRIIGRRYSDSIVQEEMEHWPFKVVQGVEDKPMIVVQYQGLERVYSAEEISSMVLSQMREIAEIYLECIVNDAVITVPAYFNDSQRRATKDAGKIAGLNVMRIINEPTAAAIAYGLDNKGRGRKHIIIFDLGGGTFDVSLLMVENDIVEVKSISGDTHLGGEDFNKNMVNYFVEEFKRKHEKDISINLRSLRRLNSACETAKKILSYAENATVEIDALYEGIDFMSKITRAKFESLNEELFKKCMGLLQQCLTDANMDKSQIDELVLVGGSTRIPRVQILLQDFFVGNHINNSINPDEAVACGAAIQAAMMNKDIPELVVLDVTPLSLGISTHGNVMSVIIPKYTPIPTRQEELYTTIFDNQTAVKIEVYEGEKKTAGDNNLLGTFRLTGITSAPAGEPSIPVVFEIDEDGIFKVTAIEKTSGQTGEITIVRENFSITEVETNTFMINLSKAALIYQLENYRRDVQEKLRDQTPKWRLRDGKWKKLEKAIVKSLEWVFKQRPDTDADASKFNDMRILWKEKWEKANK